jgi:hypothetical protein
MNDETGFVEKNYVVNITNMLGQSVYRLPLISSQQTIETHLAAGMYLLRIANDEGLSASAKLVIE